MRAPFLSLLVIDPANLEVLEDGQCAVLVHTECDVIKDASMVVLSVVGARYMKQERKDLDNWSIVRGFSAVLRFVEETRPCRRLVELEGLALGDLVASGKASPAMLRNDLLLLGLRQLALEKD